MLAQASQAAARRFTRMRVSFASMCEGQPGGVPVVEGGGPPRGVERVDRSGGLGDRLERVADGEGGGLSTAGCS